MKYSEGPKEEHKFKYLSIKNAIPQPNFKEPQLDKLSYTEWRWRFLNINNKQLVEISFKEPDKPRKYIDKYGRWAALELENYDQYVVEQYYAYTQNVSL
jgi:hypothetical protein